jgi:hypothetical protein
MWPWTIPSLLLEGLPVDFPETRQWGSKLKVSAETLETRLVGEALPQEVKIVFKTPTGGGADIQAFTLATFLATHLDVHGLLWICPHGVYKVCLP